MESLVKLGSSFYLSYLQNSFLFHLLLPHPSREHILAIFNTVSLNNHSFFFFFFSPPVSTCGLRIAGGAIVKGQINVYPT